MEWNYWASSAFLISHPDWLLPPGRHGLGQFLFRNRHLVADATQDEVVHRFSRRFGQQPSSGCAAPERRVHWRANTGNSNNI